MPIFQTAVFSREKKEAMPGNLANRNHLFREKPTGQKISLKNERMSTASESSFSRNAYCDIAKRIDTCFNRSYMKHKVSFSSEKWDNTVNKLENGISFAFSGGPDGLLSVRFW